MNDFNGYVGRMRVIGGRWTGLPQWARLIVGIAALPAIVIAIASVLGLLLALLALLLIAAPVYSVLKTLTAPAPPRESVPGIDPVSSSGVKRVESTVVE